uniref:Venom S1 protease 37 n=1 Tax=Platymeris rhadamanthus TaxID=1134088 RepID=A0A6B9L577_PLARH|nr:venom S1 protease 37 [Platymeris rhadamanthus]
MISIILSLFLLGAYFTVVTLGQTIYNVRVYQGHTEILQNPEYPDNALNFESTLQWNLQVEPDANIIVHCDDIRMGQRHPWDDQCRYVYLSFDDGQGEKKVCGRSESGYMYKSRGSILTVKLVSTSDGSGFLHCMALNTKEPNPNEIINLHPNEKVKTLRLLENSSPFFDRVWLLRSIPGTRISLQCEVELSNADATGCELNVFTFNDGQTSTTSCGYKKIELITKENHGKVRVQLDKHGKGKLNCILQAVTGPNINEYYNAISEEVDSSEHGMKPGHRGTSCDCGRANKNSARIIFGIEAKPNEFPWMVNLIIWKGYKTRCGGSLITRRHVLTAAHCLVNRDTKEVARPENVDVVLAEHDRSRTSGNEVTVPSERIFIKEEYLESKIKDIAIIYTAKQIEFNDKIGPLCLEPNPLPIINRRIIIMGWGLTEKGNEESNILLKSRMRVMDSLICRAEPYDVCANPRPSNTCNGDSGSPLVWVDPETNRYVQVSIVSRGATNDCKTATKFSTEIAYFYGWIQEIIQRTNPAEVTCHKI